VNNNPKEGRIAHCFSHSARLEDYLLIIPVILAGGSGTRLWPLSRESYPKQFLRLVGHHSLLQKTALRTQAVTQNANPLIICNEAHYFLCLDQLAEIGLHNADYIVEPQGKNTAPAIAAAALYVLKKYGDNATLLIMPSDHLIQNHKVFKQCIETAEEAAAQDKLVTFGITPSSPKTGFGYIKQGHALQNDLYAIDAFVEKPDKKTAEQFLQSKDYLWNAGIFIFKASNYMKELHAHSPAIATNIEATVANSETQNNILHLNQAYFSQCPNDSIDYAVMEKTSHGAVIPMSTDWNDLGSWNAVSDANPSDENNNVVIGDVLMKDTQDCFLHSETKNLSALGLRDIVVVSTEDSVLVAHKHYAENIKAIVNQLKEKNNPIVSHHNKVLCPWGYYKNLAKGAGFQIKHMMLKPGTKLLLKSQQHQYRHCMVLEGAAEITQSDRTFQLGKNESACITNETRCRLSNLDDTPLQVIEVQLDIRLDKNHTDKQNNIEEFHN